jgi:hypothetical protein
MRGEVGVKSLRNLLGDMINHGLPVLRQAPQSGWSLRAAVSMAMVGSRMASAAAHAGRTVNFQSVSSFAAAMAFATLNYVFLTHDEVSPNLRPRHAAPYEPGPMPEELHRCPGLRHLCHWPVLRLRLRHATLAWTTAWPMIQAQPPRVQAATVPAPTDFLALASCTACGGMLQWFCAIAP